MNVTILTKNDLPNVEKTQRKFNIFRVINIKTKGELEIVEFFNKDGVFRGFGKDVNSAYKRAKKVLRTYYN